MPAECLKSKRKMPKKQALLRQVQDPPTFYYFTAINEHFIEQFSITQHELL